MITNDNKWTQSVTGVRFGPDDSNAWGLDTLTGVFATGTTCITVPDQYYSWMISILNADFGMNYTSNFGEDIFLTSCVQQFNLPKLYFLVGGYWF